MFFNWDVAPTVTTSVTDRVGCLFPPAGPQECFESHPIRTTISRIHGGEYGVDWSGDSVRDGTLTLDVELASEVMSNPDGTYSYWWKITNFGTGSATGFLGGNPAGFDIVPGLPLLGRAGPDRIPGTADDLFEDASQTRGLVGSPRPPRSEAWGIIANPSSGFIGTIVAPTPSTLFDWDAPPAAASNAYQRNGCLPGVEPCYAPGSITGLSCRITGTYGVDYTGDGASDGTMTADVRLISEVLRMADGSFTYWWQIANHGSGPIPTYLGANTPQFAISAASPLGTTPLVTTMTSAFPPGSEAWGIIANPSSGEICELLAPQADSEGPVITSMALSPNLLPIGASSTLSAMADESTTGGLAISGMEWRVGAGDWIAMTASDGGFDGPQEWGTASVTPSVASIAEVCVRAVDSAGNTGRPECALLVAYDPSAGFVTGGGWIDSPPGACAWDPGLAGRAAFGFTSKYVKGASVPTGNAQFTFKAGGLDFHSASYEWMVVTGGGKVQFKGSGTVKGIGDLGFLIFATDAEATQATGDSDSFRIRIWDKGDGDSVVYDNGLEQPLAGGSIVVHTGKK
jgi:hypothetical protein